jgi:chemotaxis protein methyltransferase CheR
MSLSPRAFDAVVDAFAGIAGIRLTAAKKPLVEGRLRRLAQERGIADLDSYVDQLLRSGDDEEMTRVVDRLTTNETYFFREPKHFEHLADLAARHPKGRDFRVWSAASSSGEEAYSIAMVLADRIGARGWEVVGTDLSTAMVDAARRGLYPMERARHTPQAYLKRYCLRGQGPYEGQLLIARALRERARFQGANLMQSLPEIGRFDVIFLRNVLIYFEPPQKAQIVRNVISRLAPGGLLYTGHAESLGNLDLPLRALQPAVYEPV